MWPEGEGRQPTRTDLPRRWLYARVDRADPGIQRRRRPTPGCTRLDADWRGALWETAPCSMHSAPVLPVVVTLLPFMDHGCAHLGDGLCAPTSTHRPWRRAHLGIPPIDGRFLPRDGSQAGTLFSTTRARRLSFLDQHS